MKIIVGLGNPGLKYRHTRHNIGFLIVKSLAERLGIRLKAKRFKGVLGKGRFNAETIFLFMPMTFMNLSGEATAKLIEGTLSRVKKGSVLCGSTTSLKNFLVIHDDIDLRFGDIRIREKGTHGGHRGLMSIIENLDTEEFPRLRIGIRGREKIDDASAYVLSPFTSQERPLLEDVVDRACRCVSTWLEEDIEVAMNRFNRRQALN